MIETLSDLAPTIAFVATAIALVLGTAAHIRVREIRAAGPARRAARRHRDEGVSYHVPRRPLDQIGPLWLSLFHDPHERGR